MDKVVYIFRYFSFLFRSGNEHSIHSPFVFELYLNAIKPSKKFYIFHRIENLRAELKNSSESIIVQDFGAGSKVNNSLKRKVSSIAKHSEKSPRLAQLIFQLIEYFKSQTILDLGTSFGLTTAYQATVNPHSKIYTFEGCPQTAQIARKNFKRLNLHNIQIIEGNLDITLPQAISKIKNPDFIFFDANHRCEPTMRYFNLCMEYAHENSVFVFDDIHWSSEMETAWKKISEDQRVTISIDLFHLGLVFFRKRQPKQHFRLRL